MTLHWLVIAAYLIATGALGVAFARKHVTKEYFVGGRRFKHVFTNGKLIDRESLTRQWRP